MTTETLGLEVGTPEELLALRLLDLPHGGLFVASDTGAEPGDPVAVDVRAPGIPPVSLKGAVVWRREAGDGGAERPRGVGIGLFAGSAADFEDLLEACRGRVEDLAARRSRRYPVAVEVSLGGHGDRVLNVSVGGMFVGTKRPLPVGDEVRFELALPGTDTLVTWGEVMWQGPWEGVPGVGVRFLWRDPQTRSRLVAYLDAVDASANVSSGSSSSGASSRRAL